MTTQVSLTLDWLNDEARNSLIVGLSRTLDWTKEDQASLETSLIVKQEVIERLESSYNDACARLQSYREQESARVTYLETELSRVRGSNALLRQELDRHPGDQNMALLLHLYQDAMPVTPYAPLFTNVPEFLERQTRFVLSLYLPDRTYARIFPNGLNDRRIESIKRLRQLFPSLSLLYAKELIDLEYEWSMKKETQKIDEE